MRMVGFDSNPPGRRTTPTIANEPIDATENDEAFLRLAEARQGETHTQLETVSVYYNFTSRDRVACLAYDGIFRDASAGELPFSTVRGQACRHPSSPATLVRIELSR